jgi:hypothetical protein
VRVQNWNVETAPKLNIPRGGITLNGLTALAKDHVIMLKYCLHGEMKLMSGS